jgi:cobalamin biosynthesis Mg chelatase CobN
VGAVNPHALRNILDILLEVFARGLWQAGEAIEEARKQAYLYGRARSKRSAKTD